MKLIHSNSVPSNAKEGRLGETSRTGFTLVEVMIAMIVAALVVASTFKMLSYSRDILRSSAERVEALNHARGAMEYLRTLEFDHKELKIGVHSTLLNGRVFRYSIIKYNGKDDLKQITLESDWLSSVSGKTRQVELISILSAPLHQPK